MKEVAMRLKWIGLAAAGVLMTACSSDPHVQNSALGGAAIGGLAGAIIGNNTGSGNAATGAAIGAAAGAAIGAAKGCSDIGGCGNSNNRRQYYDERAGRYYYYDSRSGRYYWENGQPRY
jgi:hypothetical protein